ncbi:hypothetical protein [Marinobacter sp. F4218]|uniref:hypothetical protein n=1 Tax=Marinobacter sp. F4218 TaxID=2862868 RepID=UPI001C63989D|nr:hypothetical protein [Marinobacter sp. F4218]MBW7472579.1 hypothetical protein [Marinobacter sp. F4218]
MNEILNNISSISWWFGVVFVGVIVSLTASYIKPRLDTWLANFSKAKREKNERAKRAWAAEIGRLQSDELYRAFFASRISHEHAKATFITVLGVAMFLMSGAFSLIFQFPEVADPNSEKAISEFLTNLPKEEIIFVIKLFLSFVGSISLLLGMAFFKSAEKLQAQFEESVEELANKQKQPDA